MALLANRRHELFAQAIVAGKTNIQAYEDAGYSRHEGNASTLRGNQKVAARIKELSARAAASVSLTKEWVIEQLIGVVIDARNPIPGQRPDSAGANKALNLLGLELGMFVERKEVGKPGEFDGLTIADKRARIMGIAKELGLDRISATERIAFTGPTIDAVPNADT